MSTRYLDRRGYLELVLVLVIAFAAVSFGRWVIPDAGSSATVTALSRAGVPAQIGANLAEHKQDVLDSQDRAAAVVSQAPSNVSFEEMHAERSAIIQRLAALKQAQLETRDRPNGLTP